jgi:short-subunit dehydrogenase
MGTGDGSLKWIWRPFANLLAERKANLVLVARRTEPMEKLAEELRQNFVQVVVEGMTWLRREWEPSSSPARRARHVIDIGNAGYGLYGAFLHNAGKDH